MLFSIPWTAVNRIIASGVGLLEDHILSLATAETQTVLRQQLYVAAGGNTLSIEEAAIAALKVQDVGFDELRVLPLIGEFVYLTKLDDTVLP